MIKISKNAIIVFFLLAAVGVSIHPLFAIAYLPYKLFLVYGMIFTAAFFMDRDIRIEKDSFINAALFTAGAAMLGAGQYIFSFFRNDIMVYGVALMLCGIAAIALAQVLYGQKLDQEAVPPGRGVEITAIAVLLVVAFVIRFWDLSNFLPGVWFDEAQNGNEALRLMAENRPEVFIARYTNMPAMYFYFAALAIKLFGFNIFPLRLVSCVLGTLSVAAFYFLAKQVFKGARYAFLAALLLAFSRWHITFSRVAFLGMQTVLFEILFLYFYLKFLETRQGFIAAVAGALLGLAQYTFSAANFLVIFTALHIAYMAARDIRAFVPAFAPGLLTMAAAALIAAGPLILYAVPNRAAFFQRASDVSIMNDIRDTKNLSPVLKNLQIYSMVFNYEGDYNGRHNLYKKPVLDDIGGVFFIIGLIAALLLPGMRFLAGLLLVMLIPGIATITIEAPQAYRIIGVIPAVCLLITFGIKNTAGLVAKFSKKSQAGIIFAAVAAFSIAAINFHQYFFLYPKHEGTYMSFSPEANGIAQYVKRHIGEYEILISPAQKMYGFYMWEQREICDFINYGNIRYRYMEGANEYSRDSLAGKKGVIIITRPTDVFEGKTIQEQYKGRIADKEVFTNPYNGNEIFTCWTIKKEDLLTTPGKIVYVK